MASAFPLFSKEGSDIVTSFVDLVDSTSQFAASIAENDTNTPARAPVISCPSNDSLYCTSCKVMLQDRQDQLFHYRLDWHRINLKRKVQGKSPLSAEAFEEITSDVSSISGSDSDTDGELSLPNSQQRCSQFITFATKSNHQLYMIHRTVLFNAKHVPSTKEEVAELITSLARPQIWVVFMRSAGHFAGAVFKGSEVMAHKTFHRYTVRAKRGTVQSTKDSQQGHQPKSAGASLRRHNEAALEQEIQDLVLKWSEHIEESNAIFIRAPVYGQATFFGGKKPLFSKGDMRLRTLPFPVRRPTFNEVKRVHSKLATLYYPLPVNGTTNSSIEPKSETNLAPSEAVTSVDSVVSANSEPTKSSSTTVLLAKEKEYVDYPDTRINLQLDSPLRQPVDKNDICNPDSQTNSHTPTTMEDVTSPSLQEQFQIMCTRGDFQYLLELLAHSKLLYPVAGITESVLLPSVANTNNTITNMELTNFHLLHIASTQGHWKLILLLLAYGADPAMKDEQGRLSYNLARDKKTRDSFRKFMGKYPEAYDYAKAQVPSPLTDDMELARKEKLNEKKKAQKRAKKLKEVEQKVEEKQQQTMENLSLREKCAIAAERRIANSSPASSLLSKKLAC